MKSRMLWLSYGDANTHFFHVQVKIKRARQHIATLKDESEEWIRGSNLPNHVINHFQCLFQSGMSTASLPLPQTLFSPQTLTLRLCVILLSVFQIRKKFVPRCLQYIL